MEGEIIRDLPNLGELETGSHVLHQKETFRFDVGGMTLGYGRNSSKEVREERR